MPTRLGPTWDDALEGYLDPGELAVEGLTLLPTKRGESNDVPGKSVNVVLTTHRVCFFTGLWKPKALHWWFPLGLLSRIDADTNWTMFGLNATKATTVTFVLSDGETFTGRVGGHGSRKQVAAFIDQAYLQRSGLS